MHVKCAVRPCAINMTMHGIFTTFSFQLAEMFTAAPLTVLFWKVPQHFRSEQAEHAPRPVLLAVTHCCPEQANWECTVILRVQISATVPLGGGTYQHFWTSQPAWLSWRMLLVCCANMGLYFWASGGRDLPVSCSCLLFHRAVASRRHTSSFFFHTHFSHDAFSVQELWRNISILTLF